MHIAYTYACPVWKAAAKNHIKKLQIIQNKCLKIINAYRKRYSTRLLHKNTKQDMIKSTIEKLSLAFHDKCKSSKYELIRELA